HQRGRVRDEVAVDHHVVEGGRDLADGGGAPAVPRLTFGNRRGHAPAHLLRRLDDLAAATREVALPEHAQRGLGPLTDLRRTSLGQHAFLPFRPPGVPEALPFLLLHDCYRDWYVRRLLRELLTTLYLGV